MLGSISKAIAAGVGGAAAGTVAIPFMPDNTPWYGYIIAYAVVIGLPAVITYLAPKNVV